MYVEVHFQIGRRNESVKIKLKKYYKNKMSIKSSNCARTMTFRARGIPERNPTPRGPRAPVASPTTIKTVARTYADVVTNKPKSYYDIDSYVPFIEDHDIYSLVQRVGNGKYSIVFDAIRDTTKTKVIIKVLKPVRSKKIKREIMMLHTLRGGPNIVNLQEVIEHPKIELTSLIFERLEFGEPFKNVHMNLSLEDIHYYSYEILKALDYCHSMGIMHRDIKPQNIIVDVPTRRIRLIDWGLADFYRPKEDYTVRVASRYYKSPELLVSYNYYDYSLDIWSFGCMFASMILKKDPFFRGNDNPDQLKMIVKVLGTDDLFTYAKSLNIKIDEDLLSKLGKHDKKAWQRYINSENEHLIEKHTFDLLEKFLTIDHVKRITASEAMRHSYFEKLKNRYHYDR